MKHKRIDHRAKLKQDSIYKNFWKEFEKRGFNLVPENDGVYRQSKFNSTLSKNSKGYYQLQIKPDTKINIVSGKNFMKMVSKIEGIVKYKLFE
jgi:hypothetical protein